MSEISAFGFVVFIVASATVLLLASAQVTARLPLPGAAFFLAAAATASNLLPDVREAVSIRTVERIAVVALIVILFDGGMNVGWHRFRGELAPIGLLGVVGTAGTAAVTAVFAHYLLGFEWILAGIIGAALAPTDPAVMFSVLRGRQIGGRASTVLEGESGVNDAVSIALVVGLVDYAHAGHGSLLAVLREFVVEIGLGFAIGAAAGSVLPHLLRHARFPAEGLYGIAALAAAALAYGSAAYTHGSGFLAVFVVGVLLGAERTPHKGEIERFSRALASFAEMAVFAALGLTIDLRILGDRGIWYGGILLALLLVLVARPVTVLALTSLLRMRWGERLFLAWAGTKGAASILLAAVAVLAGYESERMYGIVFIAVVLSVAVQGGTVRHTADRCAIKRRFERENQPERHGTDQPADHERREDRRRTESNSSAKRGRRSLAGANREIDLGDVRHPHVLRARGRGPGSRRPGQPAVGLTCRLSDLVTGLRGRVPTGPASHRLKSRRPRKEVMNDMTLLFEPFAPLFELSRGMDRLFAPGGTAIRSFVPAADVVVTDDDVTVTMDVPGLKADDISIELEGDVLTVRGERTSPYATGKNDEGRAWQRLERGFGKFERVLRVPRGLDPDAITASMADGVLTLHIPMPEARKPRRIEIATGDAQRALEQSPNAEGQQRELAGTAA